MRPRHKLHPLSSFPVYSCAFLAPNKLIVGGGGGASKTGIKNKLQLYEISNNLSIDLQTEYELEVGEDAPMSMAAHLESASIVCGVNSVIEKGVNENCRSFRVSRTKFELVQKRSTILAGDENEYQKITVLSKDGSLLAVASSHDLALLSYPSLKPVAEIVHTDKEIYDASFSNNSLVITTTHHLIAYSLPTQPTTNNSTTTPKKAKKKPKTNYNSKLPALELQKIVSLPSLTSDDINFRGGRFHPLSDQFFYTVINTVPPRLGRSKPHAYVCKWNTPTWTIVKSRKIGDRITCMDISLNGRFLAFASSELSVVTLDGTNLTPLFTILKAHEWAVTTVKFNPTGTLLASGSADSSVRIIEVPPISGTSASRWVLLLVTIVVILLAFLGRQLVGSGVLRVS